MGALRGQLWRPNLDAIALFSVPLRAPSRTKKVFSLPLRGQNGVKVFSVPLRGPPWTKGVAVAVLRAPPRPSVDKRCCRCRSPCPSAALRGQKVLPLPFSAPLRGPPWTKGVAVAVLRAPPRPSVDKRCCRCRFPPPSPPCGRPSRAILASELRCVCPDLHPHSTSKIRPLVRQFPPALSHEAIRKQPPATMTAPVPTSP